MAVTDQFGVPGDGSVVGVSLNVTAVDTSGPGGCAWALQLARAGDVIGELPRPGCDRAERGRGTRRRDGEVCISSLVDTEVIVDITDWFDAGLQSGAGRVVDTRTGLGPIPGR